MIRAHIRLTCGTLAAFAALGSFAPGSAAPAATPTLVEHRFETEFTIAAFQTAGLGSDGAEQLILVGERGEVTTWPANFTPNGAFAVKNPERCLLSPIPAAAPDTNGALAALTPDGLLLHPFDPDRGILPEAATALADTRLQLRIGAPRFSAILQDVNDDGRHDLLLPQQRSYELWLQQAPGQSPQYIKTAEVRTDVRIARETDADALTDRLENSFHIPSLHFQDVNGDSRADLLASTGDQRSFHIQTADGLIPPDPSVVLDLDIFRDTTPRSDLRPGQVLAGSDNATLAMQDLNGDEIPDYVIAHRRKLWVFHGSPDGPQFTQPSAIMKTAEDVTVVLITPLDDDPLPDLLLLRVQIPSIGMILKGLFSNLDIEISATGYANQQGTGFAATPQWRGGVTLRLPELMKIVRDPQSLIARLQDAASRFRDAAQGDFNGDGQPDLALLTPAGDQIEIWLAQTQNGISTSASPLRNIFFEDNNRVWDIDRILNALGELAENIQSGLTSDRPADITLTLDRNPAEETLRILRRQSTAGRPDDLILLTQDTDNGGKAILRVFTIAEPQ